VTGPVLVVGATGKVGEGIVAALLEGGRQVIAAARTPNALAALAQRMGDPEALHCLAGSLESDTAAAHLAREAGALSAMVVAVNGARQPTPLSAITSEMMADHLRADLLTHYIAVRHFLPLLPKGGCFIGIGGGSADFILEGGVAMSMAQAALRQMYRGFAHEREDDAPALRELILASVITGREDRDADPLWVTAREVGDQVRRMIAAPADWPGAIWRMSRRGADGLPVITPEPHTDARRLPL